MANQRRISECKGAFVFGTVPKAFAAALLLIAIPLTAQAAFQEFLWGARPTAMGGAFTAVANDANAPAYNPAGISLIPDSEVTIMYAQLYTGLELFVGADGETSDLGLGYMSIAPNVRDKRWGSFAFSWSNFTASHLSREDAFTFTYAESYIFDRFEAQPVLAFGANLKFLRRSFSTDSRTSGDAVFQDGRDSTALTGDVGAIYKPNFALLPGLNFGLALQNVTEPDIGLRDEDKVPLRAAIGVAYQDPKFRWLNPALDVAVRDGRTLVSAGWESYFSEDRFAARVGGSEDQLAGGLGYRFEIFSGIMFRLDYAILWPLKVEGTNGSHRVSLTSNF